MQSLINRKQPKKYFQRLLKTVITKILAALQTGLSKKEEEAGADLRTKECLPFRFYISKYSLEKVAFSFFITCYECLGLMHAGSHPSDGLYSDILIQV